MTLQLQLFASGLLAILLHESAHVLAAGLLGVKVKGCGISWRGAYIRREAGTAIQNVAISLAGPVANLLCVGCIFLVSWLGRCVISFAFVSLILGVHNLLPLPLTDGKRVLTLLRNAETDKFKEVMHVDTKAA